MSKNVRCEDCGWQGPQDALIVKIHALLCPDCRYVVMHPKGEGLTIPVTTEGGQIRSGLRSKDSNNRQP